MEGTVIENVYLNTLQHSLTPQIQTILCKEIQFFSAGLNQISGLAKVNQLHGLLLLLLKI
jgi:hypothetical protein